MKATIIGLGLLATLLVAACSSDGSSDDSFASAPAVSSGGRDAALASPAPQSTQAPTLGPAASAPADAADGAADSSPVAFQTGLGINRSLVYTAEVVIVVDDVALATRQAQNVIATLGGLVFGQDTTTDPYPRTVLTFRVLPGVFSQALERLADIGELESQRITTDDVTELVVDLESRILTAAASVARLRDFLDRATNLESVATLEGQLLQRETDLERLRGQLRSVKDVVALATIFVTIVEKEPPAPEPAAELVQTAYIGGDSGERCPGENELSIDEDDAMTLCVIVTNTGNVDLTEMEVRDPRLGLDADDFVVLDGDLAGPMAPGERFVGYFETTAERQRFVDTMFSAVPVDGEGEPIRIFVDVDRELVELTVIEDHSPPGFLDGLSSSWDALTLLAAYGILVLGVALPFAWVPVLAAVVLVLARRLRNVREPVSTAQDTISDGDDADR